MERCYKIKRSAHPEGPGLQRQINNGKVTGQLLYARMFHILCNGIANNPRELRGF